jgi:hypothetical protein
MKKKRIICAAVALLFAAAAACLWAAYPRPVDFSKLPPAAETGEIWLYGEEHASGPVLERELELWRGYYGDGMRDLFVELPYYTAEYLNLWLRADDDVILDELYDDWEGTAIHRNGEILKFYRAIKQDCPETVFHGTDVGHQYDKTGQRYLALLEARGEGDSEAAARTREAIEQGKRYYARKNGDAVYRENRMTENFAREFDRLSGADVMGIYGAAHTNKNAAAHGARWLPCMAKQLAPRYGARLHTEDLSGLAKRTEPIRVDELELGGKTYRASYFGEENISAVLPRFRSRAFWRLEDAYDDLKDCRRTGDKLPFANYPMKVSTGEAFLIEYTLADGSVTRKVYLADGTSWQGGYTTVEISIKQLFD